MTAKVISLRRVRRQQARSTARAKAGVTAAAHGERRDLAAARRAEAERAGRVLDGHRRDDDAADD